MTITCKTCGVPKADSEFRHRLTCRACEADYFRMYQVQHRDKVLLAKRAWAATHRAQIRQVAQDERAWRLSIGLLE